MKAIITLILITCSLISIAQNPLIVKSVGTTVLEPANTNDQEFWKWNEWNGKRFYQGKGTPTKLCITDGTTTGTAFIADIGTGDLTTAIPAQDFMYILTTRFVSTSPYIVETQIWKSDGTTIGTSLIFTLPQAPLLSSGTYTADAHSKRNFSIVGNKMYFGAYDAANGNELWVTEGTAASTAIVKDIKPGTGSSSPLAFCKLNNEIFFSASETGSNRKLWKTDGTPIGTVQIAVPEPFLFVFPFIGVLNNKMIFYGTNNTDGYEPYVSDGTAAGTFMLANINPTGNSHTGITENVQFKFNSKHCFFISTNGTNKSLWRTDGTSAGTIQLTNDAENVASNTTSGSSEIDEDGLWILNNTNYKLYKSDGTVAGTYLVTSNLTYPSNFKIFNKALWFKARTFGGNDDEEPWRSDGTAANTNKALDVAPGVYFSNRFSSSPFAFFEKNNKLYFFGKDNNFLTQTPMALYQYTGDFTFNGSLTGGKWKDSANWNSVMPPGITDTVNINGGTQNMLNITGAKAYAGLLNLGNNAIINLSNSIDSLVINNKLISNATNNFTGNGILVLKNNLSDTVKISNSFTANNLAVLSNTSLLAGTVSINNLLNLYNGKLFLNSNVVLLQGNSSVAVGNLNSYIVTNGTGKLTIQNIGTGARVGAVNYPIGTVSNYNPIQFTNTGVADNFSARVQPTLNANYTAEIPIGSSYGTNAVNATWFINEEIVGGSNASINLQWNTVQELIGFDRNISQFGHYTGNWQLQTPISANGANPYNLTGTGITSFSPFGVFNAGSVLPLSLIKLSVIKHNNHNSIYWNINNLNGGKIEIQKSSDGLQFYDIKTLPYNNVGNMFDENINNTKTFYRLKLTEVDGKILYSNVVMISNELLNNIQLYPTITTDYITIQNNEAENSMLICFREDGKIVFQKNLVKGTNIISVNALTAAVYFYQIKNKSNLYKTGKFIKS